MRIKDLLTNEESVVESVELENEQTEIETEAKPRKRLMDMLLTEKPDETEIEQETE